MFIPYEASNILSSLGMIGEIFNSKSMGKLADQNEAEIEEDAELSAED